MHGFPVRLPQPRPALQLAPQAPLHASRNLPLTTPAATPAVQYKVLDPAATQVRWLGPGPHRLLRLLCPPAPCAPAAHKNACMHVDHSEPTPFVAAAWPHPPSPSSAGLHLGCQVRGAQRGGQVLPGVPAQALAVWAADLAGMAAAQRAAPQCPQPSTPWLHCGGRLRAVARCSRNRWRYTSGQGPHAVVRAMQVITGSDVFGWARGYPLVRPTVDPYTPECNGQTFFAGQPPPCPSEPGDSRLCCSRQALLASLPLPAGPAAHAAPRRGACPHCERPWSPCRPPAADPGPIPSCRAPAVGTRPRARGAPARPSPRADAGTRARRGAADAGRGACPRACCGTTPGCTCPR